MKKLTFLAPISILLMACGAVQFALTLRAVVAAGAPIFTILQQQGKITESQRLFLVADLGVEASNIQQFANCLDQIPSSVTNKKPQQLQCTLTLDLQTNDLLKTGHFRVNESVQQIADDIQAVLDGAIIFYGGTPSRASRTASTSEKVTEDVIKERIKKLKKDMGQ